MAKETILILDNEFHIQWTLKTLLENEKYIVVSVDTIERAIQNFREFEISGLVTEYWINHSNTIDIIIELKKISPELYVMMLTNEDVKEREYEAIMEAGIDDFFLKPFSSEKILLHLKKGLRQRKIFLQKRRIEHELNQIKMEKKILNTTQAGESLSANKSLP